MNKLDGYKPVIGLEIHVQLIGPAWGDEKVFNVGYAHQQETDWHTKKERV